MSDSSTPGTMPSHWPRRSWAMIASGVSVGVCLTLTLLAALARSKLDALEHASTAEGNESYMWANPLMVSLSLAFFFALVAVCSIVLFVLCFGRASHPHALKRTWLGTTAFSAVVLAPWSVAGAMMSFGSTKDLIEKACATLDPECFPSYTLLEWISIPAEICAAAAIAWMLTAVKLYCSELHISMFSSSPAVDLTTAATRADEEAKLVANPKTTANNLARSSRRLERGSAGFAYSVGRHRSRHRRREPSESTGSSADDGGRKRARSRSSRLRHSKSLRDERALEKHRSSSRGRSGSRTRSASRSRSRGRGGDCDSDSSDSSGYRRDGSRRRSSARY